MDENSSVIRIQAGVVLEKLDSYLADHDLMVPLDLGAKGSCQLGGVQICNRIWQSNRVILSEKKIFF